MAGELEMMRRFYYTRMQADTTFRNTLAPPSGTDFGARVWQGRSAQGSPYRQVQIRDLGPALGGTFRAMGLRVVWVQRRFLVTAIDNRPYYPSDLADLMEALFRLDAPLVVTGGLIQHCYFEEQHTAAYEENGQEIREQGHFWIIAAIAQ